MLLSAAVTSTPEVVLSVQIYKTIDTMHAHDTSGRLAYTLGVHVLIYYSQAMFSRREQLTREQR